MTKILKGLLFLAGVIVLLAGCQATPEEPIVVQKDMEQMIEKAEATYEAAKPSAPSLRERTGAPEKLSLETTEGVFALVADAPVTVPDANSMPIIRVRQGEFTQEQVSAYWNALVGDTVLWRRENGWTKSELEVQLVNLRKTIAEVENEPGNEDFLEQTKAYVEELEAQYASAPDEIKMTMADSTLREATTNERYVSRYAFAGGSTQDNSMGFSVQNITRSKDGDVISPARMGFYTADANHNYGQVNTLEVDVNTVLDDSLKQHIKTTPAQAQKIVEDFLAQMDTPMVVYGMRLVNDEETGVYDGKIAPAEHYAYRITCIRLINGGLPGARISGSTYVMTDTPLADDQFSSGEGINEGTYIMQWNYEEMGFMVNDNGIISVEWSAPLELLETTVDDCALLSFSEAQAILEKMMPITYSATAKETDNLTCRVNEVRLEMMRVVEQGSIESGLLVPVWNFYGVRERIYKDEKDETGQYILLCVNAIDGSVIDISKGY